MIALRKAGGYIMKKLFLLLSCVFIFASCNLGQADKDNKCSLCIRNEGGIEHGKIYITDVYVKEKNKSGYEKVYSGSIENGKSEFISIDEGEYSVKIETADTFPFGLHYSFTTGYNVYKKVSNGNVLYVNFDGNGIYFE